MQFGQTFACTTVKKGKILFEGEFLSLSTRCQIFYETFGETQVYNKLDEHVQHIKCEPSFPMIKDNKTERACCPQVFNIHEAC